MQEKERMRKSIELHILPAGFGGVGNILGTGRFWWHEIGIWRERARQRRALTKLDTRLLDDIGLSRSEAVRESARPFWR
jgi:uncharacterized protein YjiS (DUF1127 family)